MRKYQKLGLGIGMMTLAWTLPAGATPKTESLCKKFIFSWKDQNAPESLFQQEIAALCKQLKPIYQHVPPKIDALIFVPALKWLDPNGKNRMIGQNELRQIFGAQYADYIGDDLTQLTAIQLADKMKSPNPLIKFLAATIKDNFNSEDIKGKIRTAYFESRALEQLNQAFISVPETEDNVNESQTTKSSQTNNSHQNTGENSSSPRKSILSEITMVDWILLGLNGGGLLLIIFLFVVTRKKLNIDDLYPLEQDVSKSKEILNRFNTSIKDLQKTVEQQSIDIKELKRTKSAPPLPPTTSPQSTWPPPQNQPQSNPPFNFEKAPPLPDPKQPRVILQKFLQDPQAAITEYNPIALVVPTDNQNARRNNPSLEVQLEQRSFHNQANYLAFETHSGKYVVMPRLDFNFQAAFIQQLGLDYLYDLSNRPAGNAGTVKRIDVPTIMTQDGGRWQLVEKGSCAF